MFMVGTKRSFRTRNHLHLCWTLVGTISIRISVYRDLKFCHQTPLSSRFLHTTFLHMFIHFILMSSFFIINFITYINQIFHNLFLTSTYDQWFFLSQYIIVLDFSNLSIYFQLKTKLLNVTIIKLKKKHVVFVSIS